MVENILEKVLREVEENPELAYKLYDILRRKFVTIELLEEYMKRSDRRFSKLLREIKILRRDWGKRFEAVEKTLLEHSKRLEAIEKTLLEHTRLIGEVRAGIGGITRRLGMDLEKTILNVYRDVLEGLGIKPGKVEKFIYKDIDGKYYKRGPE
ncbi:MAG: DUF3782 domain-containing protein [Candidatus Methanomethylicia archaeon]